jgi:DNA-binding transcriptional LysR family regulator
VLHLVQASGSLPAAGGQLAQRGGQNARHDPLETEIGARLVVRSGRAVRPTEAAATILARSRDLLEEVRDIKSIAASGVLSGELRVGAMQTALSGLLANILCHFSAAHPQIELRIVRDHSAGLYRKLLDGEVDVAVTSHPPFAIPKTCDWCVLREEPFVVLVPASSRSRDPYAILRQEPFIRLDRKVYAGQLIDAYLREVGGAQRLDHWAKASRRLSYASIDPFG